MTPFLFGNFCQKNRHIFLHLNLLRHLPGFQGETFVFNWRNLCMLWIPGIS
jgi:hypothetical protein